MFATDRLIASSFRAQMTRRAALLGVFVSEYVSFAQTTMAAEGALTGIAVDREILSKQHTINDPDFELLQAFADALQVDLSDLLNRSAQRQEALDIYVVSLTNVAERANQRFGELTGTLEELKTLLRTQSKEQSDAERALKNAISNKQFSEAGDLQKTVLEKQQAYADTNLKSKQTDDVLSTLNSLLTLYGEKILAIKQNREILIAGNHVADVPGIEELKIIERKQKTNGSYGKKSGAFDGLFGK